MFFSTLHVHKCSVAFYVAAIISRRINWRCKQGMVKEGGMFIITLYIPGTNFSVCVP